MKRLLLLTLFAVLAAAPAFSSEAPVKDTFESSTIYTMMGLDFMDEFSTVPAFGEGPDCSCCPATYLGYAFRGCLYNTQGQVVCVYQNMLTLTCF